MLVQSLIRADSAGEQKRGFCHRISLTDRTATGIPNKERVLSTEPLKIRIKRIDPGLPLPTYQTAGSVGFDLLCREAVTVPPGEIRLIPANVIVAVPPGYMLMLAARSSLPLRKGLLVPNGVGIVDQDYHGPDDEVRVQVYNFTGKPVDVARGERLAQGVFVSVAKPQWVEVDDMQAGNRGGFGSTGD